MGAIIRSTTILSVRRDGHVALGGDGQVTMAETIAKHDAVKVRRIEVGGHTVLAGFAGAAADAFALLEKFETKLKDSPGNIKRAAIELAKLWRTDRMLRRLESLLAVADAHSSLLVSGQGDVIEPTDGIIGIGSGGTHATAAARALLAHTDQTAEQIVHHAMHIAADLCVYTNDQITIESL
jgi:ATP-dependent HslUV protease subunit HslV